MCDTGETCVLAFLKSLQERYFYHRYICSQDDTAPVRLREDTLVSWEHRLSAINIPADDFIKTVKTDVLAMLVQHSGKNACLLEWLCNGTDTCKKPNGETCNKILTNRRLDWLEYPFLINFAAAKRVAGWTFDANEILDFYRTFTIGQKITVTSGVVSLIKSFCGFLDMLYNTEDEHQDKIATAVRNCIKLLVQNLKDDTVKRDVNLGSDINTWTYFANVSSLTDEDLKQQLRDIGDLSKLLILKYFAAQDLQQEG